MHMQMHQIDDQVTTWKCRNCINWLLGFYHSPFVSDHSSVMYESKSFGLESAS